MRMTVPTIIEFVTDPQLLGLHLSPAQETLLRSIYGLPLTGEQLQLWRRCTGRDAYHAHGFAEATILAGARAGKDSRIAAPMVVYEAVFGDHDRHLARGERGVVPLVAQNVRREALTSSIASNPWVTSTAASSIILVSSFLPFSIFSVYSAR